MPHSIHRKRRTRSPRTRLLAGAALLSGVLVAGCGGSSGGPTAATGSGARASGSTAESARGSGLAFAKCMRSHGVPNFPDPQVSGHTVRMFGPNSGVNPQSPAFQSAEQSCQNLLPKGPPSSGPPSQQAQARMLRVSQCMRAHGIAGFPDPITSPPSNRAGYAITGNDGVFLAIPNSIDTQSPAFEQAAATCNFGPRGGA